MTNLYGYAGGLQVVSSSSFRAQDSEKKFQLIQMNMTIPGRKRKR